MGILCGNAFTIWLVVGSLLKPPPRAPSTALTTYADGCSFNNTTILNVQAIVRNHTQTPKTFFYIPDG
jgi:hypothetical protein